MTLASSPAAAAAADVQLPSWVVVPSSSGEEPPACRPEQMRIDDCLNGLRARLDAEEAEEAAFLAEVEEQEQEEEAAFLAELEDEDAGHDDEDEEAAEEAPPADNEPRCQVVYEAHGSVRATAARFLVSDADTEAAEQAAVSFARRG